MCRRSDASVAIDNGGKILMHRCMPLVALAIASCTELGESPVRPATVEELRFRLEWHQNPQSEIVQCHTFRATNEQAVEVDRVTVDFPTGSHHIHLYRSTIH